MKRLRPRLAISALFVLLAGIAPAPAAEIAAVDVLPYRTGDKSITALNILPPGQGGYLNAADLAAAQGGAGLPAHFTNQSPLYEKLIANVGNVTAANLGEYFKDASFGVPTEDIGREYSPRPGVDILRDKTYNVPHIYGDTRSDTMFGAGYASAEDRLFMMDVLRATGRGHLTELIGPSESNIRMDCSQFRVADYTETELQAMIDQIPNAADQALAQQARQDVTDYTAGVNQYITEATADPSKLPGEYGALQIAPKPWMPTDTVAVASLIGGNLGVGGGGELENAQFLNALIATGKTESQARTIMADLRLVDDPEAPSTTDNAFPWNTNLGPIDPTTVAAPDPGTEVKQEDDVVTDSCTGTSGPGLPLPRTIDGPLGPIQILFPDVASNALLVGSNLSKSGHPIAVFGPQVAYWSPEILMELDLHGPGIDARGVGFPGISMYVLLGRGDGYGWSATSASGDQVDIRAVKLCDPLGLPPTTSSSSYVRFDGVCTPITPRSQTWTAKPSAGSCSPPEPQGCAPQQITMRTERVELAGIPGSVGLRGGNYGLIQARGVVDGQPVAFARQRVSYGGEVDSALTYIEMMNPDLINGAEDFQRAFSRFNFTFNWFYVDGEDIAFQLGGAHPLRAPGTDPDLPVWDADKWRWPSLLSFAGTPKDISPAKGYITSWNNKQAPGFRAPDDSWGFASVDRVQPLNDGIESARAGDGKVDLVELVQAMGNAATVDLRGYKVLPLMLEAIGDPGTPRLRAVVSLLQAWNASGAHRLDADGNGEYEHQAAIAVMDAWWKPAVQAVFGGVLGAAFDDIPVTLDDAANSSDHNGSSFNDGFYGQVQKDLRSVLGKPVQGPFSRKYCGEGNATACRTALLNSLDGAVTAIESAQGANPGAWQTDEAADEIRFTKVGVQGVPAIPWQNRPTFQQVLEFRAPPSDEEKGGGGKDGGGGKQDDVAEQIEKLVALCLDPTPGLTQILGTDGADVLSGTSGPDVICGYGGRDRLIGLAGNDVLIGGDGKDVLLGGTGRDRLVGESEGDVLRGGKGRDILYGGAASDRCAGGPGRDKAHGCEHGRV
jgi:acyl-homoserine lactone acylase PvdQ